MSNSKKKIYWTIGIAAGVLVTALVVYKNRKSKAVKTVANKIESWLQPLSGVKISSKFGYRTHPITKEQQFHNGIDLPVPSGTKVKNPFDGVVTAVLSNDVGGNQLTIKHDSGYTTGYAHLTKALVKKGDKVKQGDVIALSGNTGKTTGPHLHFTLKDGKGAYLDPAKIVYAV